MNVAKARELMDDLHEDWHFESLAWLLEDLRHTAHPRAPQLRIPDYVMLVQALWTFTPALALPQVSYDKHAQALYVAMRMDGAGHTLAEMLALQSPPMSNSDREFLEGHCNGSQFESHPEIGDFYAAEARARGIDIKGRVYVGGLATHAGDVRAWVRDRGEAEAVARERNMTLMGSVNVKSRDLGPPPEDVTVADDLVGQAAASMVEENPDLARADPGEVFHQARERIKPHWGK